jgi:threonine synthase
MAPAHVRSLRCLICGEEYPPDTVAYVCPRHDREGILDVQYDYRRIDRHFSREQLTASRDGSIWRYKPLLPVMPEAAVPPLMVGGTPLYDVPKLAAEVGIRRLCIKDDGRQPTASFKDRASAIAVVKAREQNAAVIATASTGNAAAALSGLCAAVGQPNVILVPESAPPAKIAQLLVFGSRVLLVEGSYDQAFDLCLQAAESRGWYNRNTGYNPYMTEGKKTAAYEICEQLNWQPPDRIFVSVGDGCIIGGIHKGLKDLSALGWIDRLPRLTGVQAEGSAFLYQAWKSGEDVLTKAPVAAHSVADSICAGLPRDRIKAMAAVRETEGCFITVSDEEILQAVTGLARGCGVFAEPAGAAAFAGFLKAVRQGELKADESVVVINTGNGLKDIAAATRAVTLSGNNAQRVSPDLKNLEMALADW